MIIPKIGDWVAVKNYGDAGKVIRVHPEKQMFATDFPAEEFGVEEHDISFGEIEYIITKSKEIKWFEKTLSAR